MKNLLSENLDSYGEVLTLHLDTPLVVLNSTEAIYEGLVKNADHMSLRPINNNPIFRLTGGMYGSTAAIFASNLKASFS